MTRILSLLSLCLMTVSAISQITITNATFPAQGEILKMALTNEANINVGTTNGPQIWDFNSLNSGVLIDEEYLDISEGTDPVSFPSADMVLIVEGSERYIRSSANRLEIVGVGGENEFIPVELSVNYSKFPVLRRAPINFIDTYSGESEFNVAFSSEILPPELLAVLPVRPDSIRIQFLSNTRGTVDAYGTLKLQNQDFEVLREKTEVISETKAGLKVFGIWLDAAGFISVLPEAFSGFLGRDTSFTYNFYSNTRKEILVSAEYDINNVFQSATFVNLGNVTSGTSDHFPAHVQTDIFPNPASDNLTIHVPEINDGNYILTISDVSGRYVHFEALTAVNGLWTDVETSSFLPGQYVIQIRGKHNNTVISAPILIQR